MKKSSLLLFSLIIFSALILSACQTTTSRNTSGKTIERPTPVVAKPDEEILPFLQLKENGQESKIILRSQTSHFLNGQKSALEIDVTSSKTAYCQNEHPALKDKEEELIVTLKSNNPSVAIGKGEFANNKDFIISAVRRTAGGQTNLPPENIKSFKITDINNAVVRGSLSISSETISISGEYFTAICR